MSRDAGYTVWYGLLAEKTDEDEKLRSLHARMGEHIDDALVEPGDLESRLRAFKYERGKWSITNGSWSNPYDLTIGLVYANDDDACGWGVELLGVPDWDNEVSRMSDVLGRTYGKLCDAGDLLKVALSRMCAEPECSALLLEADVFIRPYRI